MFARVNFEPLKIIVMENMESRLMAKDWKAITEELHDRGFVIVPDILNKEECEKLIGDYGADNRYRKTIVMERDRFGLGEYKYFQYPFPELITAIREKVYRMIAPVANQWMLELNMDKRFPASHAAMRNLCQQHGQVEVD